MLVRGERSWNIIDELAPKARRTSSIGSGKEAPSTPPTSKMLLHPERHSQHRAHHGIATDVCVHTTMREANDRGVRMRHPLGLLRRDGSKNHAAALEMGEDAGRCVRSRQRPSATLLAGLAKLFPRQPKAVKGPNS